MKDPIPEHLRSTLELIERAYPQGVPDSDYLPLLFALYEHLSDRGLAVIAYHLRQPDGPYEPGAFLNDVLRAAQHKPYSETVMAKLVEVGFDDWVEDD